MKAVFAGPRRMAEICVAQIVTRCIRLSSRRCTRWLTRHRWAYSVVAANARTPLNALNRERNLNSISEAGRLFSRNQRSLLTQRRSPRRPYTDRPVARDDLLGLGHVGLVPSLNRYLVTRRPRDLGMPRHVKLVFWAQDRGTMHLSSTKQRNPLTCEMLRTGSARFH